MTGTVLPLDDDRSLLREHVGWRLTGENRVRMEG